MELVLTEVEVLLVLMLVEELVELVDVDIEVEVVVLTTGANISRAIRPTGTGVPMVAFIVTLVPLVVVSAFCISEATVENPPALALEPVFV